MDWKPLFKTFVTILFGFSLGLAAGHWRCGPRGHGFGHPMPKEQFLEHFAERLQLSAEQKGKAGAIFEKQREKVSQLHSEVFPKFDAIREETRIQIRELLNPEQLEQFDRMHDERELARKRGPGMHGDGPPPPPDGMDPFGPPPGPPPPPWDGKGPPHGKALPPRF